jgi:hypothetical protein
LKCLANKVAGIIDIRNLKGRDQYEYLGTYQSIIFKGILKIQCQGVDWINLDQDRDLWSVFCEHGDEPSFYVKVINR